MKHAPADGTVDDVFDALADIFEDSSVETGLNGWPTTAAVANHVEYHKSVVAKALQQMAEDDRVERAESMAAPGECGVATYAPTDAIEDDADGPHWWRWEP